MIDACIAGLLRYAEDTGLIEADDRLWARNRLLEALQLDGCDPDCAPAELPLADLLRELTEDAVSRGVAQDNSVARDLFDTKLMGALTPAPHEVRGQLPQRCMPSRPRAGDRLVLPLQPGHELYPPRPHREGSEVDVYAAPIRRRWTSRSTSPSRRRTRAPSPLPRLAPQSGYPKCRSVRGKRGLRRAASTTRPGRTTASSRCTMDGSDVVPAVFPVCLLQRALHRPERGAYAHDASTGATFRQAAGLCRRSSRTTSSARTPTCPSSAARILSHDHFQGGHYTFAMEKAPVEEPVTLPRL